MPEDHDDAIESGLVNPILADVQVAIASRRLCRTNLGLRILQDAIHVASYTIGNIDQLHTFDARDLIKLEGQISDG